MPRLPRGPRSEDPGLVGQFDQVQLLSPRQSMTRGKDGTDGFLQDALGGEVIDEWRTSQAGVEATVTETLDEARDRNILRRQRDLGMSFRERSNDRWNDLVADRG